MTPSWQTVVSQSQNSLLLGLGMTQNTLQYSKVQLHHLVAWEGTYLPSLQTQGQKLVVATERLFCRYLSNWGIKNVQMSILKLSEIVSWQGSCKGKAGPNLKMECLARNPSAVLGGFSFYLDIEFHLSNREHLRGTSEAKTSIPFLIINPPSPTICQTMVRWPSLFVQTPCYLEPEVHSLTYIYHSPLLACGFLYFLNDESAKVFPSQSLL